MVYYCICGQEPDDWCPEHGTPLEPSPDTVQAMTAAKLRHRQVLGMMFTEGYKLAELQRLGYLSAADMALKRAQELRVRDGLAPSFSM